MKLSVCSYRDIQALHKLATSDGILAKIPSSSATYVNAKIENKSIGMARILHLRSEDRLGWLFVLPTHRGQGIGKSLLEFRLSLISRNIITAIVYNPGWYVDLGFSIIQERTLVSGRTIFKCRLKKGYASSCGRKLESTNGVSNRLRNLLPNG